MMIDQAPVRRLAWTLLAGTSALLLAVGLLLLFSHFQALAQPATEIAALLVQKEVNTSVAAPGDVLTYTITIQNSAAPAGAVWLTDTLPAELDCITESLTTDFWGSSFGVEKNVITWTATMYGNGQTAVITFSARISSEITYAEIENTAQVTGTGELITDSAHTTVVVHTGNLDNDGTYKTLFPFTTTVKSGDVLTYVVMLRNNSEYPVLSPQLTDPLHPALTCVTDSLYASQGNISYLDGQIMWSHSEVQAYNTILIRFSAQISQDYGGLIVNTAEIATPGSSFTRTVETYVQHAHPHLEASKSVSFVSPSREWVRPGEYVTYTVCITNTGDGDAETVWMTDELPSEVSYVPGTLDVTMGMFGEANGVITWNLTVGPTGTLLLPPQGKAAITYTVEISPDRHENYHFTNTAEITGAGSMVQASVGTTVMSTFKLWLPLILRNYPPIPDLNPIPAPDASRYYTVTWQGIGVTFDHYVLQQARASNFASPEQAWTTTLASQVVGPAYCAYYYRVRADKASDWGQGPWSNVEAGVASPPDAPVLNDIPDPDENRSYTVTWSSISIDGPVEYVLQESTDPGFPGGSTTEWHTTETSRLIQKPSSSGTFYYRVRADDDDCWGQGPWSTAKSVEVPQLVYYDDFSNASSGWPNEKKPIKDDQGETHGYWHREYHGNQYRIYIEQPTCWTCGWFHQPDALAPYQPPSDKYCIETWVKFADGAYWANMGVIFGANEANRKLYALCMSRGGDPDKLGWFLMRKDDYSLPMRGCSGPTEKVVDIARETDSDREGWNRLRIGVDGNKVTVYMGAGTGENYHYKGQWTMSGLSAMTRVGVIGGNYEILPVDIRYSYFKVTPNVDCSP